MSSLMGFVFFMTMAQLLSMKLVLPCSPGPRYGYRHRYKHLSPLERGQYVPNLSETTIGASGPAEEPIRRGTSKFGDLVANYNPDVVFMDEENDGSDRVMTKRCKDRVDTLAMLVIKEWPAVRLRITEAWESAGSHLDGSLHYEGRAVDLTTDDRDTTKYPLLARLAVEAGFDWVYYKSKYFIHASVRADDSDSAKYGGCFPGDSIVYKSDNTSIPLKDIAVGNKVLAIDRMSGQLVYSDVIMLMDKQLNVEAQFTEIATTNSKITLTKNHMIFVANKDIFNQSKSLVQTNNWAKIASPVFAETVKPGQYIYIGPLTSGHFPVPLLVTSVREVVRKGVVAPLTEHGTVVVDHAVVSCYSVFANEPLAHASFFFARTFKYFRSSGNDVNGMHWYTRTLSKIANYVFPKSFFRLI